MANEARVKELEELKVYTLTEIEPILGVTHRTLLTYIKDGRLDFAELPVLEPYVRDVFLLWLSKALENKSRTAKTEDGRHYTVEERESGKRCVLQCTDGTFSMPAFTIIFEE